MPLGTETEREWLLGPGVYVRAADPVATREYARDLFLLEVQRLQPAVLHGLREEVFPLSCRLGAASDAVEQELTRWLRRFRLEAGWIRDRAFGAMDFWRRYQRQDARARLTWGVSGARWRPAVTEDEQRFAFEHPGWEPSIRGRAEATQMVREAFETQLTKYLDKIDGLARARGWRPSPQRRERVHFQWLARYQVGSESYADIARTPGGRRTPRAVEKAVKLLAREIGLRLRPAAKGGRPRTQRPGG